MKKTKFSRVLISALTLFAACLVTFMTTYTVMDVKARLALADAVKAFQTDKDDFDMADQTLRYMQSLVSGYYYGESGDWSPSDGMDDVYRSYVASLGDDYAYYYSPSEYAEYKKQSAGELVGIGVVIYYSDAQKSMTVTRVIPGSPADKGGVKLGDRITAVDGVRLADVGYSATVNAISGKPDSSFVLTLERADETFDVVLTRSSFTNVTVYSEMTVDKKLGIVTLTSFDNTTAEQFRAAIDSLMSAGVCGIVFDVRDNGGGTLDSVLSVLSYLVPKDQTLIHILDKNGNDETRCSDDEHTVELPMAVLTNGSTASAAELFTSCLRELRGASVIGERTFGKGCMQSVFELPNGGGMKLTYRMYNPPSNVSYHGIGIVPDVEVRIADEYADIPLALLTFEQDAQLSAALKALEK